MELTILVFLPAVAAAVILLLPQSMEHNAKWVALAASLAILALSVQMFFAFDLNADGYQYVERHEWVDIGQFNLQYFLGVDGLSMPLVVLTTVLTVASVLVSFSITMRPRAYYACLMVLSGALGARNIPRPSSCSTRSPARRSCSSASWCWPLARTRSISKSWVRLSSAIR